MRAWELLFGASLAFIKVNLNHKKLWFYIGITLITAQIIFTEDQNYNPLAILFVALATVIVIIANYQDSRLNNRGVQFIGKSSYSLYLWHWPIMVFCSRLMIFEATWFVITLTIITWLLSYRFEKIDKKYFWLAATIYCLVEASVLSVNNLHLNEKLINKNEIKDLSNSWKKFIEFGDIKISLFNKSNTIDMLFLGDSNICHYLDYFSRTLNFKYVELNGSINYGKNVKYTDYPEAKKVLNHLHSNIISSISAMPPNSKVVIANLWQRYVDIGQHDPKMILSEKYKNDILGGIIDDIENIVVKRSDLSFYIVSQGVFPSLNELSPVIESYYLGTKAKYVTKIKEIL